MIDTRPLWVRALAKRGIKMPATRGPRLFAAATEGLTGSQFLNLIRSLVGLGPLYRSGGYVKEPHGLYVRLEALRRAARPDCKRCGGSGYFDAEWLDMHCECTGLPLRAGDPRLARSLT